MDERRALIYISATLFILIILFAVISYYSGGIGPPSRSVSSNTSSRFTAQPGTTRENAQILTSSARPATGAAASISGGGQGGASDRHVHSLSEGSSIAETGEVAVQISALQSAGDTKALLALAEENNEPDTQAYILDAAAQSSLLQSPPDYATAEDALAKAEATVESPVAREQIAITRAKLLLRQEDFQAASKHLEAVLSEPATEGAARRVCLRVLLAQSLEAQGMHEDATAGYATAIEEAGTLDRLGLEQQDAVRLAGMRLARLQREQHRNEEAAAVGQRVQAILQRAGQ